MTRTVEVTATLQADPATVFAMMTDGARWAQWAGPLLAHSSQERAGDPAPGGIGGVRKLGLKPFFFVREKTVAYEQDRKHSYTLLTPAPVKDYLGELILTPREDGGTNAVLRASFTALIPGTTPIVGLVVRGVLKQVARSLARATRK